MAEKVSHSEISGLRMSAKRRALTTIKNIRFQVVGYLDDVIIIGGYQQSLNAEAVEVLDHENIEMKVCGDTTSTEHHYSSFLNRNTE